MIYNSTFLLGKNTGIMYKPKMPGFHRAMHPFPRAYPWSYMLRDK